MTVKELRDKLDNLDDNYILTVQTADGMKCEVSGVDHQGNYLTIWGDRAV